MRINKSRIFENRINQVLIKPVNGEPFIEIGLVNYRDNCFYVNGSSYPQEIVEKVEDYCEWNNLLMSNN